MRFIQDNLVIFVPPIILFFLLRFLFSKFPKQINMFMYFFIGASMILILGAIINKSSFYINTLDGRILLDPMFLHFGNTLASFVAYLIKKLSKNK